MNNIPFTSKKQFHAISALISSIFSIKQNRVEHKISEKCRFKNANAFINAIEKQNFENKELKIDNSHLTIFSEEDFVYNQYLFTNTDFSLFLKENNRIPLIQFNAPFVIQLLTNKFIFKDIAKLSEVFELVKINQYINCEDSPCYEHIDICYDYIEIHHSKDTKVNRDKSEKFHLSYFQHVITGYVFNLEELKQFNLKQIEELIFYGNKQQYNIICNNFKQLINDKYKDKIAQCLNIRYFEDLAKFKSWYEPSDSRQDLLGEFFNNFFHPYESNQDTNNDNYFIDISTPPVGYLSYVDMERLVYENSPIETVHMICFENEAKQLLVSEPTTDRDFKILNHLLFIFESGLLFANNDVSANNENIKRQSFIYSDLISLFHYISNYVSDDLKSEFFNSKIKNGFYNHFHFEEEEHKNDNISLYHNYNENYSLDLPLFDWFVFSQIKEISYNLELKNNEKNLDIIKHLIKDENSLKPFRNDIFWNQYNVIFNIKDENINDTLVKFKTETNCSISNKDVLIKILKLLK